MQTKFIKILSVLVFSLFIGFGQITAQSTVTGGIRGTVSDPQNAIVPNATVTVTNNGTNKAVTVNSNENGVFIVNNLQPGTYAVVVSQSGFGDFSSQNVIVEVGQTTNIDATLALAGQTATVEVTADAPVINTEDNANSTNVNQTSINELPINGRRASNFVILTPATVPDGQFGLISFRGISGLLNNSTIDGGDNNQAFFSEERGRTRISYSISQSAIREFQVNGSNYSAEYGRAAGGVINTVTKSGTNEFHGDVFYYNRNNRNGARNPRAFNSVLDNNGISQTVGAKPIDLRQQYGFTLGGPLPFLNFGEGGPTYINGKDKLFFFFSFDQQKRNFPGLAVFSNPNYLNTVNRTALTTRGLSTTQINNGLAFINSLSGETPRRGDQTLFLPKIDYQINNKNLFSATYNRLRWESPSGVQTQAVNQYGRRSFGDDFVQIDFVNLRLQSTISPNLLNEARFQYGRDLEFQVSQSPLAGEPLTAMTSQGIRAPNVFLSNGLQFGTPTFLERGKYPDERRIQFADTVTYTTGKQTFKFGLDINRVTDDTTNLRYQAGAYSYSTINDFILDYTNYLSPLPTATVCPGSSRLVGHCYNGNFSVGVGTQGLKIKTFDYNFFIQDDIRLTPRLTLNLGLRYEYEKLPDAVLPNTSTNYSNVVIPNVNRTFADVTSYLPNDKNNFGPRVGFAYDVFGDGKTSVRGGAGIYYGRIINSTIYNALLNTGNPDGQFQINLSSTSATSPVFPNVPVPSRASIINATTPPGAIQFFQKNFQAPEIYEYDLIVEREVARNTVVSVSYLGSTGRHLPTFVDTNFNSTPTSFRNFTINGGPFAGQTFTYPVYSRVFGTQAITEIQSSVRSQYNALVLQANRRFTNGLQFQASYTFAKATDENQNSATFTQNNSPLNVFDRSFDNGPSNNDVRHKFVVSAVYAPTFYKGDKNSLYSYLVNGFSIAPIYTYYSGRPFDGTVSASNGLNGTNGDSRFPLVSRNAFRLPSLSNFDLRLSKRFNFSERYSLELLAEGFNVFNRTQVFDVNRLLYTLTTSTLTTPLGSCAVGTVANTLCYNDNNFGQITTTDSTLYRERQIQFSARFQF